LFCLFVVARVERATFPANLSGPPEAGRGVNFLLCEAVACHVSPQMQSGKFDSKTAKRQRRDFGRGKRL
jgi:hypothetical protein